MSETVLSTHALDRFAEHLPELLLQQVEQGIPYGAQLGQDQLLRLPCGLIAATTQTSDGQRIVTTVLPRDYAIANMQHRGLRVATQAQPVDHEQLQRLSAEEHSQRLQKLAISHINSGYTKKQRNADLRQLGYDLTGEDGRIYREHYLAEMHQRNIAVRAEFKRSMKGLQV